MNINSFDKENNLNAIVFIHEYWHYLQNITTLHGIMSFCSNQHLLSVFSNTLKQDGTSFGSYKLSEELRSKAKEFIEIRKIANGDRGRDHDEHILSEVTSIVKNQITFELRWPGNYYRKSETLNLGAHIIKESIAHIVECKVARLLEMPSPKAPEFPYSVLYRIFKFIAKDIDDDSIFIAALGTLALLTLNPGLHIEPLFEEYRNLRKAQKSPSDTLLEISKNKITPFLITIYETLKNEDLNSILNSHRGRGTSEKAVKFIIEQSINGLARRIIDPLFDIRPFIETEKGVEPIEVIIEMAKNEFPPCDLSSNGKILSFLSGEEDENGLNISQYLRSFQAQQEFMMMHLKGDGFASSSELSSKTCSYYKICTHPTRTIQENNCKEKPWANYTATTIGCWFTNGVSATLGPTQIQKIEPPITNTESQ